MRAASAYGLELQARSIAPFYHSSDGGVNSHRFLVGTSCFSGDNKIYLLEYQDDTGVLECSTVWFHDAEVLGLWGSSSTGTPGLFAVGSPFTTRVFRAPGALSGELQEVVSFAVRASHVFWVGNGPQNEMRLTTGSSMRVYAMGDDGGETELPIFQTDLDAHINCAALDTHRSSVCMVACEALGLYLIDTRKKKPDLIADTASLHGFGCTRCIDFSSVQMNLFLTSGDDGYVLWHDMRVNGAAYAAERRHHLRAHNHAVSRALFNPFHDELLLSCSADHTLKLWDASKKDANDGQSVCLKKLTDFGDSVVDACWSSSSPWVFAGVSYNGKILVSDVPKKKKLEILLKEN